MSEDRGDFYSPLRLRGKVQSYFWGKVGRASRIYPFNIASGADQPLAEYWLGAHPKGASTVALPSGKEIPLDTFLGSGITLPFMMKVLSINPEFGLSIQTHPDKDLTKVLHARDPEHYPDPFHKPEIGVAVTPVSLLYGFKPSQKLRATLKLIPELRSCLNPLSVGRIMDASESGNYPDILKGFFADLLTADAKQIGVAVEQVVSRAPALIKEAPEVAVMERLARRYGSSDSGLLAMLMMNLVVLNPGEAIFIGPNIPHAYLDGDLVECMACSDNVIRAGLTTKFKDSATLIACVDYERSGVPTIIKPSREISGVLFFELPVTEFSLGVMRPGVASLDTEDRVGIVLCLGGEAVVTSERSGVSLRLGDGGVALLQESSGVHECAVRSGEVFVAVGKCVPR